MLSIDASPRFQAGLFFGNIFSFLRLIDYNIICDEAKKHQSREPSHE